MVNRTITVSTAVFAAIWAKREDGEESENAILARLLGAKAASDVPQTVASSKKSDGGVHDTRNNVHFPRGFIAFRRYKRRDYEALAGDGVWTRQDTGEAFPTLNQLNDSIAAGPENVWNGNWKYRAEDGTIQPLGALRSNT